MATETEAAPWQVEPQKEHRWLHRLVGDWTFESEAQEPGKTSQKGTGAQSIRAIGDLWILGEGEAEMPGHGAATMILTLGYDPQKERFVGTWIGSVMANLWVYEGTLDAAQRVLTLDTEGPSFSGDGGTAPYHDIVEIMSDDHWVLRSEARDASGNWHQFMTAHYRRKK